MHENLAFFRLVNEMIVNVTNIWQTFSRKKDIEKCGFDRKRLIQKHDVFGMYYTVYFKDIIKDVITIL